MICFSRRIKLPTALKRLWYVFTTTSYNLLMLATHGVILIFLDMSAAFDAVVHYVLLDRLANRFGVRDVVLSWFSSYLTNRKQFVGINESSSSLVNLDVGVPQGAVQGLFFTFSILLH